MWRVDAGVFQNEAELKAKQIFFSWLLTILFGGILAFLIAGELEAAPVFSYLAAIFSLPYLIVMLLLVKRLKGFLKIQIAHTLFALLTAFVVYAFGGRILSGFYWATFIYYGIGVVLHYFFWRKNKSKG